MAITNFDTRELTLKILFVGPRGAGKSSNLKAIYRASAPEVQAGLFDLEEGGGESPFEFLPLSLGYVRDYHLKVHLFSFDEQHFMPWVTGTIFKGLDGLVFVFDSRVQALDENVACLDRLGQLMQEEGLDLAAIPKVYQYNKMDQEDLVPLKILKEELNPAGVTDCVSVASTGEGSMETLTLVVQQVLKQLTFH